MSDTRHMASTSMTLYQLERDRSSATAPASPQAPLLVLYLLHPYARGIPFMAQATLSTAMRSHLVLYAVHN